MSGVLAGGWGFVWAAYGLTLVVVGGYLTSVLGRYRGELRRLDREAGR
jgi:heme exporter protein CcmD